MRLSMWMIANRLHALEPEVCIKNDAPMELCSARTVIAPKCVYVYRRGKDVVCKSGENYIVLHDIEFNYIFNLIQGIFDFYNDWSTTIQQAVYEMNFQKVLDECWFLFCNPLILMDGNNRCLAMCSQYDEDEVDYEWAYVAKNHYSSLEFIRKMRRSYSTVDMYQKNSVQFLHKDRVEVYYDTLTTAIYYQDFYCGRLNVLGKERSFNQGDIQVIEHLLNILTPGLYMLQNQEQASMRRGVFLELLQGQEPSLSMIQAQASYLDWGMEDIFQICVLQLPREYQDAGGKSLVCNQIRRHSLNIYVTVIGKTVILIYNLRYMDKNVVVETIHTVLHRELLYKIGISSPMPGLLQVKKYHEQAEAAIEYGLLLHPEHQEFYFYDYALYYMFEHGDPASIRCALHPDVLHLDDLDQREGTQWLPLLKSYFDNECSLVNTAKAMFVHRNTLVYRLGKLTGLMHYDWHDLYTRDYMKQSILLLDFYRKKYGGRFLVPQ